MRKRTALDRTLYDELVEMHRVHGFTAVKLHCEELLAGMVVSEEKLLAVDEFCVALLYQDPIKSVELIKIRLGRHPNESIGLPISCLAGCYSQLGDRDQTVHYCQIGLTSEIPLRYELNLLSILRRYKDVSKYLPRVFKKFSPLDDGFDLLGKLHELSTTYGYLAKAVELEALMRKSYQHGEVEAVRESPRTHLFWCDHEPTNIKITQVAIKRHHGEFPTSFCERAQNAQQGSKNKIVIGYLSSDFRDHPTSHLMMGAWRNHDRDKFTIIFFDAGWDDQSQIRAELEAFCDELVPLRDLADDQAAKLIERKSVDVLIELNGPTQSNRLGILKYRPAPFLVGYLGWPGSYGGGVVEYVIGDDYIWPPLAAHPIPEKILRLSGVYQINDHRNYPSFRKGLGQRSGTHLKGESVPFRFGSINNINKLTLSCWDVWMHILKECPDSELQILSPGRAAAKNLESLAKGYGVNPERLRWLSWASHEEHLGRIGNLDLILDTWPYGGHTTTADALAAGVPVLTLEGKNFAGRVSGSLLTAAGLGKSLIAKSEKEYAQIACALYASPDVLKKIYDFMARNLPNSSLFDSVKRTRDLEAVLERLVRNETR